MATMIWEIYDALREAGASEDKAKKAAEAMTQQETRFGGLETKLAQLDGKVSLVQWMLGFNLVMTAGILLKLITG